MSTIAEIQIAKYNINLSPWPKSKTDLYEADLDTYTRETELTGTLTYGSPKITLDSGLSEFQKYLLSWPLMTDEELSQIEEKRKHFNKWR